VSDPERVRTPEVTADILEMISDPIRWEIYTRLRNYGARKAPSLARRIGIGETSMMRHLRMLEEAGFVATDDDAVPERQRNWRHIPGGVRLTKLLADGVHPQLIRRWIRGYAVHQAQLHREWVDDMATAPEEWQNASMNMGYWLRLTAEELEELTQDLRAVLEAKRWMDTSIDVRRDDSDPQQRIVYVPMNAFPVRGER